jgi:predicted dehydrogenase
VTGSVQGRATRCFASLRSLRRHALVRKGQSLFDIADLEGDMMIHDFDLARWLLGEETIEVYATASCLVEPAIGQAGDIDTAAVVLRTQAVRTMLSA